MTQLNLVTNDSVPEALTIALTVSPNDPLVTLVDVRVLNHKKQIVASYSGRWGKGMPLYLPDAAKAAVEAYLYASGARDVVRAVKQVGDTARADCRRAELAGK